MQKKVLAIGCLGVFGFISLGCGLLVTIVTLSQSYSATVRSQRYQQVIEQARQQTIHTTETIYFKGNWVFDVAAMPGQTNVCARKLSDGSLFVRIVEVDRHHAGKFGFLYSEQSAKTPETLESDLDGYGCGEWDVTGHVLGNWWRVENRLG